MKTKRDEFTEFSIRVPKKLDELICKDAETNKCSKNLQVNVILEKHYGVTGSKNSIKIKHLKSFSTE
ncbi:MAG TPA: hypothetical protein VF556_17510 [Pyrinomonadaceae bacterium]|jgi:hypothetical protein